jgi:NAD(P)-dependent dehydrogenase (short-subunit alcohol dehydrogenase family)
MTAPETPPGNVPPLRLDTDPIAPGPVGFMGSVNVLTENGSLEISKIVKKYLPIRVACSDPGTCRRGDPIDLVLLESFARAGQRAERGARRAIRLAGGQPVLTRDGRGNESQFSANHLGHFQLTLRLSPALIKAGGARVVELTSRGHRFSEVVFDDPNFDRRPYDKWKAYGQSKTANALFALGLDRRGETHGIRASSVHPGVILSTDLIRHIGDDELKGFNLSRRPDGSIVQDGEPVRRYKDVQQGAATTIWCATSPQLDKMGGVYCEDCDIAEVIPGDLSLQTGTAPWACDPELAEQLWALSEQLVFGGRQSWL